jgi:hypothetical protein
MPESSGCTSVDKKFPSFPHGNDFLNFQETKAAVSKGGYPAESLTFLLIIFIVLKNF